VKITAPTRKADMKDTVKEKLIFLASKNPITSGAREFDIRCTVNPTL
jgi:hypothetical protein